MAVHTGARNLPAPFKNLSSREFRWLWEMSRQRNLEMPEWHDVAADSHREALVRMEFERPGSAWLMRDIVDRKEALVSSQRLSWIQSDDDRLLIFLLSRFMWDQSVVIEFRLRTTVQKISREDRKDMLVLLLDMWHVSRERKETWLREAGNRWHELSSISFNTKWLKKNDEDQLTWAYRYLSNKYKLINLPAPVDSRDHLAFVSASIDAMSNAEYWRARAFVTAMKNAWFQYRHRERNKDKKKRAILLSATTDNILVQLAQQDGITTSDVVERLLRQTYIHPVRGKTI